MHVIPIAILSLFPLSLRADDCLSITLKPGEAPRLYQHLKVPSSCEPEKIFSCPGGVLIAQTNYQSADHRIVGAKCFVEGDPALSKERIPVTPKKVHPAMGILEAPLNSEQEAALRLRASQEEIPDLVFERALDNFKALRAEGKTTRSCFIAADLTTSPSGRMWLICLKPHTTVTKMPTYPGSGSGEGCTDHIYKNSGDTCARFFGNKENHCLSAGGRYITGPATKDVKNVRPLTALVGLDRGENDNTEKRNIGIHTTATTANSRDYVGRVDPRLYSQGCLTMSFNKDPYDLQSEHLSSALVGGGVPVYVYPSKADILAFRETGKAPYWDPECAKKIGKPGWLGQNDHAVPSLAEMQQEQLLKELRLKPSGEAAKPATPEGLQ